MSLIKKALEYKQALLPEMASRYLSRMGAGAGLGGLSGYLTGGPEHWYSQDNRLRNTLMGAGMGAGAGALGAFFRGGQAIPKAMSAPVHNVPRYIPREAPATMNDINPLFKAMAEKELRHDALVKAKSLGSLLPEQEAELAHLRGTLNMSELPRGATNTVIRKPYDPSVAKGMVYKGFRPNLPK